MVGEAHRKSDRIAALLMVLLFVTKIGVRFMEGHAAIALRGVGCVAVAVGTIVMIIGLVSAISHRGLGNPSASI